MRCTIFALFVTLMLVTPAFAQLQAPVGHNMVRMQDKFGHEVLVQMNQRTGSAHRVYGVLPNVTAYGYQPQNLDSSSIEGFSKKFFSDYSGILKINPDETRMSQLETNGKFWFVTYKQAVNGVPIHGTQIGYTIDRTGDMIALGADAYQNVSVSTIPKISSGQAIAAAEKAMSASSPKLNTPASLVIYPITSDSTTTFRLTWKVTLRSLNPLREVTYFIDAQNSQVVAEENNIVQDLTGNISGSYWPVHNYDTPANAGFWTTGIYLHDAGYTNTSYTNSDNNGNYTVSIPYSGQWYVEYPLQDSWVSVWSYNNNPNNVPTQVIKTLTTTGAGTLNLNWGASDSTSVRWLATVAHDFYKNTLNYSGMDYQAGGYVEEGTNVNGQSDGYNIYFGSQSNEEWARSSDVVYHEYAHCVIHHLYGGWIGDPNNGALQGTAMDEGLADYWPAHTTTIRLKLRIVG